MQGRGSVAHPLCSLQQEGVILPNDDLDRHRDALVWEGASKVHGAHAQQRPLVPVMGAHGQQIPISFLLYSCTAVRKGTTAGVDTEMCQWQRRMSGQILAIMHIAEHFGHLYTGCCALIEAPSFQLIRCNAAHARKQARRRKENAGRACASAGDLFFSMRELPPATWAACFR